MPDGSLHPIEYKVAIGENALNGNNDDHNVAIGFGAIQSSANASHNVAIARSSQALMLGSNNTSIGASSMGGLFFVSNTSHSNNTVVGRRAYPSLLKLYSPWC